MKDGTVHGEKLRALRVPTGMTMRELAASAGCSWRHLQMIETYGRQPGPELLYRLLAELGKRVGRTIDIYEVFTPDAVQEQAA